MSDHTKQPSGFFSLQFRLWGLITTAGILTAGASLAGFFGSLAWFLDLCAHFRVQYFCVLLAVAVVCLCRRRRRSGAAFGLLALLNLATILPLYFGRPATPAPSGKPLRVLLANVNAGAGNPARVVAFIRQAKPDVVVLEEISNRWLPALQPVLADYPHVRLEVREDSFGILLCSRFPFTQAQITYLGSVDVPSVLAEVQAPQGLVTFLATHPVPPMGRQYSAWRNGQLAELPDAIRRANSPVVLLGDLNSSPWGAHFRQLVRNSGLRDSAQGRGVHVTWPTANPFLRIPIDHCLLSPSIGLVSRQVGPDIGSDHYPLIVDFVLPTTITP